MERWLKFNIILPFKKGTPGNVVCDPWETEDHNILLCRLPCYHTLNVNHRSCNKLFIYLGGYSFVSLILLTFVCKNSLLLLKTILFPQDYFHEANDHVSRPYVLHRASVGSLWWFGLFLSYSVWVLLEHRTQNTFPSSHQSMPPCFGHWIVTPSLSPTGAENHDFFFNLQWANSYGSSSIILSSAFCPCWNIMSIVNKGSNSQLRLPD